MDRGAWSAAVHVVAKRHNWQLTTAAFLNLSETPAAKHCCHRIGFLNVSASLSGWGFHPVLVASWLRDSCHNSSFRVYIQGWEKGGEGDQRGFSHSVVFHQETESFSVVPSRLHLTSCWPEWPCLIAREARYQVCDLFWCLWSKWQDRGLIMTTGLATQR